MLRCNPCSSCWQTGAYGGGLPTLARPGHPPQQPHARRQVGVQLLQASRHSNQTARLRLDSVTHASSLAVPQTLQCLCWQSASPAQRHPTQQLPWNKGPAGKCWMQHGFC